MARIVQIKNNTAADATWAGQMIPTGDYYTILSTELTSWSDNAKVFTDVGNGKLVVNNGTVDIADVVAAWNWLLGDTLPMSDLGNKLAIHSSTKPAKDGKEFYLVWTGSGDDMSTTPPTIGKGTMLQLSAVVGTPKESIDVRFAADYGDVYIHEGYAKWENGGLQDHLCADVMADASVVQTSINLDLEIVNNWVVYAAGGAGTGTHGFASNPILIPRTKSGDGDWDYDTTTGLTPNPTGTGNYKISDIEREVHAYINRIPTLGSSYGYTTLTSDESAYLPPGYFLRITAHNMSDTAWTACVFMEVFREQTAVP